MLPKPILGPGLCECGCGQATSLARYTDTSKGLRKGEPRRYARFHRPGCGPVAFWGYVPDHLPTDVCWPWQGRLNECGYGVWSAKLVARTIYETLVGPIPVGLQIDHVRARGCTSRACVNPAHLEPVTCRENVLRSDNPAGRQARQTHCLQGHPLSGPNVYRTPDGRHRKCRICRREYMREYKRLRARARREDTWT